MNAGTLVALLTGVTALIAAAGGQLVAFSNSRRAKQNETDRAQVALQSASRADLQLVITSQADYIKDSDARYHAMREDFTAQLAVASARITDLQRDLVACAADKDRTQGELRERIRELTIQLGRES